MTLKKVIPRVTMQTPAPLVIPDEIVEEAWQEVGGINDSSAAKLITQEFSRTQPALAEFVDELGETLSQDGRELLYYAGLVVWRSFVRSVTPPLKIVDEEMIVRHFQKAEKWLESLSMTDPIVLEKKLRSPQAFNQPFVMKYVIEAVFDAHEDGLEMAVDEQGRIFLILKVLVECLSHALPENTVLH